MKYRLTVIPAIELPKASLLKTFLFETLTEASAAKNSCADLLLFMQDKGIMKDYSNIIFIEEKIGIEWVEIED